MRDFVYVPKSEWKPLRDELDETIHRLQNEVCKEFTFQPHFVGSSQRGMITRDQKSNVGFDFDVDIEVNDPGENYSAKEIRDILRNGLDKVNHPCGHSIFGYDHAEDSTCVLTIKVKDKANSRILYGCDFCIVKKCSDGRKQYIRYNKKHGSYSWEYRSKDYTKLPIKIEWIKRYGLWQQVRNCYIKKKNTYNDNTKKSRSIFAEAVHQVCQQNGYFEQEKEEEYQCGVSIAVKML